MAPFTYRCVHAFQDAHPFPVNERDIVGQVKQVPAVVSARRVSHLAGQIAPSAGDPLEPPRAHHTGNVLDEPDAYLFEVDASRARGTLGPGSGEVGHACAT
jgi:hypothetical protein